MFIDAISAYYIFIPILLPIMILFEVDPTVFGVFMTVNLAIGLFTPPVGLNLYVATGISEYDDWGNIERGSSICCFFNHHLVADYIYTANFDIFTRSIKY